MKPAVFEYHDPATVDEALALLRDLGDDAKVLAGGQSLIPMMNMRLARPPHLIDLRRLHELDYIRDQGDSIAIGALTRHRAIERSLLIQTDCPVLSAAAAQIGHFQIRERGTLGGTLAHADPTAEIPLAATLLDAEITIRGPEGERTVTPDQFFFSIFMTSLGADELITGARFRKLRPGEGWSMREFARRPGDFALVSVAALAELEAGRFTNPRIALGGVAPIPWILESAVSLLSGQEPDEALIDRVAAQAAREIDPDSDLHASAQDRRDIARTLVRQALTEAAARARSR